MFRGLASDNFAPFGKFRIDFPPVEEKPDDLAEVHVFTGVNGTGKTRLLSVMAAMLGNPRHLLKRLRGQGEKIPFYVSTALLPPVEPANHGGWSLAHANSKDAGASWQWKRMTDFPGMKAAFAYNGTAYVADAPLAVMASMPRPAREDCLAFERPSDQSSPLVQAIANLKLQAAMDSLDDGTAPIAPSRSGRIVKAVEQSVSEITGRKFSFHVASYPNSALSVVWEGVKLPFDLLPDGLRSIIGWLGHAAVMMDVWLEGKSDPLNKGAIFLLDEIESHLHPTWQRRILPAFQRLFPKAQMFVATHSPFVISSLNHGWIHPFSLDEKGRVTIGKPQKASAGDSYISVVEDIMGLREWYDPETEGLMAKFREARDAAYQGDSAALSESRKLATMIGSRSMELDYTMGRELSQMERHLSKQAVAQ